jgi:hypothetical protein
MHCTFSYASTCHCCTQVSVSTILSSHHQRMLLLGQPTAGQWSNPRSLPPTPACGALRQDYPFKNAKLSAADELLGPTRRSTRKRKPKAYSDAEVDEGEDDDMNYVIPLRATADQVNKRSKAVEVLSSGGCSLATDLPALSELTQHPRGAPPRDSGKLQASQAPSKRARSMNAACDMSPTEPSPAVGLVAQELLQARNASDAP